MADVFISYAHRDQERGLAIGRILTELGWDIWQDVNKLRPMEEFTEEIAAGIRECSVFLMLYSNAYHQSPYCGNEFRYAVDVCGRSAVCVILDESCPWMDTRYSFYFAGLTVPGFGKTARTEEDLASLCRQVVETDEFIALREYLKSGETGPMPAPKYEARPRNRLRTGFEIVKKRLNQNWTGQEYNALLAPRFVRDDWREDVTDADAGPQKKPHRLEELIPADHAARIVISGVGGLGKTTSLLQYGEALLEKQPVICVRLSEVRFDALPGSRQLNHIEEYIYERIGNLDDAFWKYIRSVGARDTGEGFRLTLLLDGMNELSGALTQKAMKEIRMMAEEWRSTDMIVSTRNVTAQARNALEAFEFFRTEAPREANVRQYLNDKEIDCSGIDERLLLLLRNPLRLTIFVKTEPYFARYRHMAGLASYLHEKPDTTGKILDNYVAAQLCAFLEVQPEDEDRKSNITAFILCELVYPLIAWKLYAEDRYTVSESEVLQWLRGLTEACDFYGFFERGRVEDLLVEYGYYTPYEWNYRDAALIFQALNLMTRIQNQEETGREEGPAYTFPHQDIRDFFAARYMALDLSRTLKQGRCDDARTLLISRHEMTDDMIGLISDVMREERALPYCDPQKGWQFPGKKPGGRDASAFSTAEKMLLLFRNQEGEAVRMAVAHLVRILRYARRDLLAQCCFDRLDLRACQLRGAQFSVWYGEQLCASSFNGAWMDMASFACMAHHHHVRAICPLPEGRLLSGDRDGVIIETDSATGKMTGRRWKAPEKNLLCLAWDDAGDRLAAATAHGIFVLKVQSGTWERVFQDEKVYLQKLRFAQDGRLEYCADNRPTVWREIGGQAPQDEDITRWHSGAYDVSADQCSCWRSAPMRNLIHSWLDSDGTWREAGDRLAGFFSNHIYNCDLLSSLLADLSAQALRSRKGRDSKRPLLKSPCWDQIRPDPEIAAFRQRLKTCLEWPREAEDGPEIAALAAEIEIQTERLLEAAATVGSPRINAIAVHPDGTKVLVACGTMVHELDAAQARVIHSANMGGYVSSVCYLEGASGSAYAAAGWFVNVSFLDDHLKPLSTCYGERPVERIQFFRTRRGVYYVFCTDGYLRKLDGEFRTERMRKLSHQGIRKMFTDHDAHRLRIAYPLVTARWSGGELYDFETDTYQPLRDGYYQPQQDLSEAPQAAEQAQWQVYFLDRVMRVVPTDHPEQGRDIPYRGGFVLFGCEMKGLQGALTDEDRQTLYMNGGMVS